MLYLIINRVRWARAYGAYGRARHSIRISRYTQHKTYVACVACIYLLFVYARARANNTRADVFVCIVLTGRAHKLTIERRTQQRVREMRARSRR